MGGENILKGCLVESDPAVIARERQAKRRALVVAIILQVLLVGLLVLAPLLGAVEKLTWTTREIMPTVPYKGGPKPTTVTPERQPGPRRPPVFSNRSGLIAPTSIPPKVADVNDPPEAFVTQPETSNVGTGIGRPDGIIDLNAPSDRRAMMPKAPESVAAKPKGPVVVPPAVQEARLVYRVDPKYPSLAQQIRLEGRVVLRAVIGRDGSMQSLEVVSGHPLFIEVSLEAIRQWRYQPTLLHGEPVEVETQITVVFTFKR